MKNIFGLGKRIVLFIAVNLLVLLTLSLLASVILHFFPHLGRRSSNPLLVLGIFSLIFGMGGATEFTDHHLHRLRRPLGGTGFLGGRQGRFKPDLGAKQIVALRKQVVEHINQLGR